MPIKYGANGLHDGTDETKELAFDVTGVTTGTTRTVTVPDKSGTLAMTSDISAGGKVLQVVSATGSLITSTSATAWVDIIKASITPISATSKIVILTVMRIQESSSTHHFQSRIRDNTNATTINGGDSYGLYTSGSTNVISNQPLNANVTNTNTNTREYSLQVHGNGNTVSFDVNSYDTTLVIMEIA